MLWRVAGLVPLVAASGPDVSRSAAGRLAAEVVLTPTSYKHAEWGATHNPESVEGRFRYATGTETVTVRVDGQGDPVGVSMERWGDPEDSGTFGHHSFGGELSEHRDFDGVRIPTSMSVGWWPDSPRWSDGEFFRAVITDLTRG